MIYHICIHEWFDLRFSTLIRFKLVSKYKFFWKHCHLKHPLFLYLHLHFFLSLSFHQYSESIRVCFLDLDLYLFLYLVFSIHKTLEITIWITHSFSQVFNMGPQPTPVNGHTQLTLIFMFFFILFYNLSVLLC